MKKQIILVLALCTLSLSACEDEVLDHEPLDPATAPKITSFYPGSAIGGTEVLIFGENFGASILDNLVTFNGTDSEVTQVGLGMVVARVPLNLDPGDYTISLSVNGRTGASTRIFKIMDPRF